MMAKRDGLRAALADKEVLTTYYDIPRRPRPVVDEIAGRLLEARQLRFAARDDAARKRAEESEAEVKAELDACFFRQEFRPLVDDAEFEALMTAHPATEEQKAKDPEADLDVDGFRVALLARCAVDSDLSEAEWRAELWSSKWSRADREALFGKVDEVNRYEFNAGLPKG